jgi:predicted RND superfamily exporter protein
MTGRIGTRIASLFLVYRKTVLAVLLATTALAIYQLPQSKFDNALEIWFVSGDPALVAHDRLIDTFSSDDTIVVGFSAPDVFTPEILEFIDELSAEIALAPHVEKVFSLTTIESIVGDDGALEIGKLFDFPIDPGAVPAVRERVLANELSVGPVVSSAGDCAAIVARLPYIADEFDYKVEAVQGIQKILDRHTEYSFDYSGGPVLDERFYALSEQDSATTSVLMVVLLVLTLWALVRSVPGVLLPIVTVVVALVWTLGWIVLAGFQANVMTTMLPALLLAVGVADSMHILVDYRNRFVTGEEDKFDALRAVYRDLFGPLFLTSLTTSVGMLSLSVSKVQGVRMFGWFAAAGVVGAFVLSITFVPIALSYLPKPRALSNSQRRTRESRLLEAIHRVTIDHPRSVAVTFAVMMFVALLGATRVQTETSFMEQFPDGAPVKVATRNMEKALAGSVTLEVMIESPVEGGIKDPETLAAIDAMATFLESDPEIQSAQSIVDYFKDLRRAFFDNDQGEYRLPETREEAAQYLLLYEMDAPDGDIKDFLTFDYSEARLSARMSVQSSKQASDLVTAFDDYVLNEFPAELNAVATGLIVLYANMETYIRDSMIRGFSFAVLAIFVILSIQMRSPVLGAIAMIPNIVPVIMCLGVMGIFGIPLDSMTGMVASISIGLAVDDSIHYIARIRQCLRTGVTMQAALHDATIDVGRALIFTSITLVSGFGVLLVAHFNGMFWFGVLCLITIVFALAADLLLLPVVLMWHDERRQGAFVADVSEATELEHGSGVLSPDTL